MFSLGKKKNNFAESLAGLFFCARISNLFPDFVCHFRNYPGRLRAALRSEDTIAKNLL